MNKIICNAHLYLRYYWKNFTFVHFFVIFLLLVIVYTINVYLNILLSTVNSLQFKYNRNKACGRRENVRFAVKRVEYLFAYLQKTVVLLFGTYEQQNNKN